MKNEILEELWKIKDQIANEYGCDIEKLAKGLRKKEKKAKTYIINLTLQAKSPMAKL